VQNFASTHHMIVYAVFLGLDFRKRSE